MAQRYYSLERIPDFTMAKYSYQENGDVKAVLKQHSSFYRQMHRRGRLFKESYCLIYHYDPTRQAGQRLRMWFRVDSQQEAAFMDEFVASTPLASSFALKAANAPAAAGKPFSSLAVMRKKDGFVASSQPVSGPIGMGQRTYYVVDEWKPNEEGRLLGLFRLMRALDQRCAYSIQITPVDRQKKYQPALQNQINLMRPAQVSGMGMPSSRDETLEKYIRLYSDFGDTLRRTPHFLCDVCAYADDPQTAKMLVDAAAAEAVSEGNYSVSSCSRGRFCLKDRLSLPYRENAPEDLKEWPALFLLEEVVHLATFPTLYPGESIEIPKETAPIYEKSGLLLGKDQQGYNVYFPLELLSKHALLAGVPGSGKTFSMLSISSQLASQTNKVPILILEPAKQEYRVLARNKTLHDLTVFSPGGSGSFPLRINPFEFPRDMKLSEHIVNLRQVFIGAFDLEAPMPFLLDQGIEQVYRDCGWYPFDYNEFDDQGRNKKPYPNMQMLFDALERLMESYDYDPEVRNNLKTVLQVRIGSLITRETGNVFNVPRSTFRPEEWMRHACVLELESLGKDGANFLTLLLACLIRELLKLHPKAKRSPRHVMFFEEAHNLIGPSTVPTNNRGNAKIASTQFIVDMLAEVRALGESIVIADQLPTALPPQVTKNTSLKIGLRITASDDREMLASTMSADAVQLEQMALFTPGQALCMYEGVQKPFEIQMSPYTQSVAALSDEELYWLQRDMPTYLHCMKKDFEIMAERLETRLNAYIDLWKQYQDDSTALMNAKESLFVAKMKGKMTAEEIQEKSEKLQRNRKRVMENKINLCRKHMEAILEFGEYVRTNRRMRQQSFQFFIEKIGNFVKITQAADHDKEYPIKAASEQAQLELIQMMQRLKALTQVQKI